MNYHIARNGQQLGVFSEQEVQSGIPAGRFLPDDLCWAEGMTDWQALSARFSMPAAPPAFSAAATTAASFNPYAAPQSNVMTPAMLPRLNLASRGSRFGAALLDGLVGLLVVGLPMIAGFAMADMKADAAGDAFSTPSLVCFGIAALGFLGLTIYNIVLLATQGQTIAKKWLGIRIVTHPDAQNPGFVKAFLLRSFVNGIIAQFVPFYPIVDACFIFREDQRCLHDLIADTTVIADNPDA
jgi:uncharacterized RDD family membrane protein YckC